MRRKFFNRRTTSSILMLGFLLCFSGCDRHGRLGSDDSMKKVPPRIEKLFEATKVICFGRILIRVPITSLVVFGWTEVDSTIEYAKGYSGRVDELVNESLIEVQNERKFLRGDDSKRLPLYGAVIDGVVPGQKIVIGSKDRVGYSAKSFVPVADDLFVQIFDSLMPEEDIVARLNFVAGKLRLRAAEEIPSEQGICIEGGFVPSEYQYERARIGIRLKDFPDVHLSVEAHKNLAHLPEGNSPRLLRKSASQNADAAGLASVFSRIEVLRDQERQLSSWTGEEFAARIPNYKSSKSVHEFRFHSMGSINDPFHPELDIRLDSGVEGNLKAKLNPSITDEEALALWDKILPTIRLRQPSDATSINPPISKSPLGSVGSTGDICPQSGWWECLETGRMDGDRRRHFIEGEKLPPALVAVRVSLWRFLIGDSERIAAVKWKLIEYENVPTSSLGRTEDGALRSEDKLEDDHA